jgi:hypothetical protein
MEKETERDTFLEARRTSKRKKDTPQQYLLKSERESRAAFSVA